MLQPKFFANARFSGLLQYASCCVILIAAWGGAATAADIRSTPHNLSGKKDDGSKLDEREICVFCHTPSISLGDAGAGQLPERSPHWQSNLPRDHSFVIYDDIGRLGLGKDSVGSQSIACLSCHDANQSFGVSNSTADHPYGIPYRGLTQLAGQTRGGARGEGDREGMAPFREARHLKALEDFRAASTAVIEERKVWWVSSSGITARRTRSDLPLYSRADEESGQAAVPFVECSSCHDPHTANTRLFLRVSNEGSKLCLTCHQK